MNKLAGEIAVITGGNSGIGLATAGMPPSQEVTHFTSVDQSAEPGFFLHFLDEANKLPGVIAWKPLILDGLRLQPGMRVLDVGCGQGADAFELAASVGPDGLVTGVDFRQPGRVTSQPFTFGCSAPIGDNPSQELCHEDVG